MNVAAAAAIAYTERMARSTKKRSASKSDTAAKPRAAKSGRSVRPLRRLDERFGDRRFEPTSSQQEYLGIVLMSLGGVAMGVGVYAMWLRDDTLEPITWAPYAIALGFALVAAYFLFGQAMSMILRVGELGLGPEKDGKVTRTFWYQLDEINMSGEALRIVSDGKSWTVPLKGHAAAARRVVAEALKRIPKRVELSDEELDLIGDPKASEGTKMNAEPPQVTQLKCAASDRELTFEADVRMCRRCAALYHHSEVPRRCTSCGKRLRAAKAKR
jgi:hypothetical protein